MANEQDADPLQWLKNKLGTSNNTWISESIFTQLNKEKLCNIKECFASLKTPVKLKLLLSFFNIPWRLKEEWKTELEEIIQVASLDSELWVSMLAMLMQAFPATNSLNTELFTRENTRLHFPELLEKLRTLVNTNSNLVNLPLEFQYLNKNALESVVERQPSPVKHFTIKRQPKSYTLRTELLEESADAQSSSKEVSAPTVPFHNIDMSRKFTDTTTPLKGTLSRVPTSIFHSLSISANLQRPTVKPAGCKEGGVKLIEFSEQPLNHAAARRFKRQQKLKEKQRKEEEKESATTPTLAKSTASDNDIKILFTSPPNQSNASDGHFDIKYDIGAGVPKTGPATPKYAPIMKLLQSKLKDTKAPRKSTITMSNANIASTAGMPKATNTSCSIQNNVLNSGGKQVRQQTEIQSKLITVPATFKIKKIEPKTLPIMASRKQTFLKPQQLPLSQPSASLLQQQQRFFGVPQQVQQPTQDKLKRTASQQEKQTSSDVTMTNVNSVNAGSTTNGAKKIKLKKVDIKPLVRSAATSADSTSAQTVPAQEQGRQASDLLASLPSITSVKVTTIPAKTRQPQSQVQQPQQKKEKQPFVINRYRPVILASPTAQTVGQQQFASTATTATSKTTESMSLSQLKSAVNSRLSIISQTIIQPVKHYVNSSAETVLTQQLQTRTPFAPLRPTQLNFYHSAVETHTPTAPKILPDTCGGSDVVITPAREQRFTGDMGMTVGVSNLPSLISSSTTSQQPTMLNMQNFQLPNRPVKIQPASPAAQKLYLQAQLQQQQQQPQHTIVSNTSAIQPPKSTRLLMRPQQSMGFMSLADGSVNMNKRLFPTNEGVMLRNSGGDMYEQFPPNNDRTLQGLDFGTTLGTTTAGPPLGLVKATASKIIPQTIHQQQQPNKQQLPLLFPMTTLSGPQNKIVQQQPQQQSDIDANEQLDTQTTQTTCSGRVPYDPYYQFHPYQSQ